MTVGQRIKQAREKRGLTQRHVAQQAAMNVALFQSYEYGKRQPGEEQLKKIADAIGVPPESLRPPKIETETELLYALREISEKFGTVLVEDEGRSVHIRLNQLQLVSEEEDQPADNIKEARIEHLPAENSQSTATNETDYADSELLIRYRRALQIIRLIVKDKVDLIEQCLERKDLKAADYHAETLKHTVDLTVQEEIK